MISRQSLRSGSFHQRLGFVLFAVAAACVLVAIVVPIELQRRVEEHVRARTLLTSNTTTAYSAWQAPSDPTFMDVYVFNLTNAADVLAGVAAPNLAEVGPLRYQEVTTRINVSWSSDGSTLKFFEWVRYIPVDDTEAFSLQNITTVNLPFIGLAGQHMDGIYAIFNASTDFLFITLPIKKLLWGYADPILDLFNLTFPGIRKNFTSAAAASAFYGHSRMYTGGGIPALNRQVVAWDGMASMNCCNGGSCGPNNRGGNRLAAWATEEANQFGGTFADQWPPGTISSAQTLPAFFPELFRTVSLTANNASVPSVSGIPVHRFVLPADPFLSEITQPANAAYYAGGPDGVANVSTCCFKANVFMSKPHFLDGDAQLLKNVTGLAPPNPALHDTYYDIEPITGKTMASHKRLQFNCFLEKTPSYLWPFPDGTLFPNVSEAYLPVLWLDLSSQVSSSNAASFIADIQQPLQHKVIVLWAGIACGLLSLVVGAAAMFIAKRRKSSYQAAVGTLNYVSLSKAAAANERAPILMTPVHDVPARTYT